MTVYPAIDIQEGQAVRLKQGRAEEKTVYHQDPTEAAQRWIDAGAPWLHVVDLDGAFAGEPKNLLALERIAGLGVPVQFGGGLRREEDVQAAIEAGAGRVVIGTRAAEDPNYINDLVAGYRDRLAVGLDAKEGVLAVRGWTASGDVRALDLAQRLDSAGVKTFIYTDIARDGMLTGPNLETLEELLGAVNAQVISSGGISSMADIEALVGMRGRHTNLDGMIIGKALYERSLDLGAVLAKTMN